MLPGAPREMSLFSSVLVPLTLLFLVHHAVDKNAFGIPFAVVPFFARRLVMLLFVLENVPSLVLPVCFGSVDAPFGNALAYISIRALGIPLKHSETDIIGGV